MSTFWRMAAFCVLICAARSAEAGRFITLGSSDAFALGQPIVTFEVFRDLGGSYSFGPTDERKNLLLDTGANGLLLDGGAFAALDARGYETVAIYDEAGVAGTSPLDVSAAYRLDYAGADGQRFTIPDARIMSSADLDFGSTAGFYGLIGMPGMAGKIMSMGINGNWISTGGELALGALSPPVTFPTVIPADAGHRYTVPLQMRDFPQSGQREPDDPLPTWAPLPFTPVHLENFGQSFEGEMLVDTGAQISVISTAVAIALGVDENGNGSIEDEAIDFLTVGGVGGTALMPIVQVGRLSVKTDAGIELGWTDLSVGVRDIDPSISGIFGMNFFTEGWTDAVLSDLICELFPELCTGESPEGYLDAVHFDFRDIADMQASMILDVNPAKDIIEGAQDGDTDNDGDVDLNDLNNVRNQFGSFGFPVLGDTYPFDGDVDLDDLNAVRNYFGTAGASAAPEPAAWVIGVILCAAAIIVKTCKCEQAAH